jgi:glycosyltransferase involved in cell wall biosynthesis
VRVAVVHSLYRSAQPSGENVAVQQQSAALRQAGIEVLEIFRSTDDEAQKPLYAVRSSVSVATGLDFGHPERAVAAFAPDIVHVHNTVPNFGTRWLTGLPMPVITTLHNFRVSCANGLLYRDGGVCLECPTSGSQAAVRHGCYQGSRLASLPMAISTSGGAAKNRLLQASDAVVTQSLRVHDFMLTRGVRQERLHLIPGFVEQRHEAAIMPPAEPRFAFVGRVTPEKGLSELLEIWPNEFNLDVIGANSVIGGSQPIAQRVEFLGNRSRDWIGEALPSYTALVFPGRVWEGAYPLVVREALEAGVPVVVLDGSGAADLIAASSAGAVYLDGSPATLMSALEQVISEGLDLRERARRIFERDLTQQAWIDRISELYRQVLTADTAP